VFDGFKTSKTEAFKLFGIWEISPAKEESVPVYHTENYID